ncbi:MAG TPA: GNAT family N-acetyltransferase [Gemmatimonadaceae bacterium]|nr:GNAT family N-acetyltransferase [Gemmatimonadaceae bacterium]
MAEHRIRRATPGDAAALSAFAAWLFDETFGPDNDPEDMAAYLAATFSPERQAAEIADPAGIWLIAEGRANGAVPGTAVETSLAGYAHLIVGAAPNGVTAPAPLEVRRFYVARAWHGRGVAGALMDAVVRAAGDRGAQTLWLAVWQHNPRAIAFYRKAGFVEAGTQSFRLGRDVQQDLVMTRPVRH